MESCEVAARLPTPETRAQLRTRRMPAHVKAGAELRASDDASLVPL